MKPRAAFDIAENWRMVKNCPTSYPKQFNTQIMKPSKVHETPLISSPNWGTIAEL
jgi:hypothetical protein